MIIGIVSDTHGFFNSWKIAYEMYLQHVDLIIHAGDILYCSPGYNLLTEEFNPGMLSDHLNNIQVPIIFCKGDNDSDVDQKKLRYPIQSHFAYVYIDGISIIVHHGESENFTTNFKNRLTPDEMELYAQRMNANIFIMGRTHRPILENRRGILHINPGSPIPTVHDNISPSIALMDTFKREVKIMSVIQKDKIISSIQF